MADRDDSEEKGFLSRWSQRKQTAREEEAAFPSEPAPAPAPLLSEEEEEARRKEIEDYVASLPEPESLTYESDFTAFFREGVPEALKRRALRVLWRSNPTLANLDGLIDYGQDFTNAATVVPNLKTLYRVGKGMFSDEDLEAEERKRRGEPAALEAEDEESAAESMEQAQDASSRDAPLGGEETEVADAAKPVDHSAPAAELSTKQPSAESSELPELKGKTPSDASPKPVEERKRSALARRWGAES